MPSRPAHASTRSAHYSMGPGADLPVARVVALLLVLLPIATVFVIVHIARAGPSQEAVDIANFDARAALSDNTPHFLPKPQPAVAPNRSAAGASSALGGSDNVERVKVTRTGGSGAILRAEAPDGRTLGSLRDGTVLEVIEHRTFEGSGEWLHVRTADGLDGWVFGLLIAPLE